MAYLTHSPKYYQGVFYPYNIRVKEVVAICVKAIYFENSTKIVRQAAPAAATSVHPGFTLLTQTVQILQ